MALRLTTIVALTLVAAALAGCAQNDAPAADAGPQTQPVGAFSIAREQVIDTSGLDADELLDTEDADEMLREIARARLVVRVGAPGVYTLAYTDAGGHARQELLGLLAPGTPRVVEGVDPLTDARLLRDGELVHARPALHEAWWHVGALPLGFWMEPGASARYDYTMRTTSELELRDYAAEEVRIDLATMALDLPLRGSAGWIAVDEGAEGTRLGIDVELSLDATEDVLSMYYKGLANGTSGEVGIRMPPPEASSKGGFSMWAENGQVTAGRFDGASAVGEMRMLAWATGGFEDAAEQCPDGMRPEDPCEAFSLPRYEKSVPMGDVRRVDEQEPEPMTQTQAQLWERAFDVMARGFAEGLEVGDSLTVRGASEPVDTPFGAGMGGEVEYVLSVAARERIEVPAGAFDAFRVAQSMRVAFEAESIVGDFPIVRDLAVDETISRTTVWLDATTYQPLRVTAETPFDADRLIHDVVGAMPAQAWEELGFPAPAADAYRWTVSGTMQLEARSIDGRQSFSPMMGMLLATTLGNGMPLVGLGIGSATALMGDAPAAFEPFEEPMPTESREIYLEDNGVLYEGSKDYTVTWASPGFTWEGLVVLVDGAERTFDPASECARSFDPAVFTVCGNDFPETWDTTIDAGDVIRLRYVEEGMTLELADAQTGIILTSITVG